MAKKASSSAPARKSVFTPNEAAELLMVSPITIRQWAQKGLIEAQTTAGGHRRFTVEAIRRFAEERNIDLGPALSSEGQTLLIVDDDTQLNNFLLALFSTQVDGLTVHTAYDGFQAGRMVQAHQPDVVLLDVMMPGMDGVAVCTSIKQDPQSAHTRVVGMTGHHSPELEGRMLKAGAAVLLRKPFNNDEVVEACGFAQTEGAR